MRHGNRTILRDLNNHAVSPLIYYALLSTYSLFVKARSNTVIEIAPASTIRVFDYAESLPI